MIKDNILEVEKNILAACKRSNRSREEITLIAVSKTKPIEFIEEAIKAGIYDFGENKVQELCEKSNYIKTNDIKTPVRFHMIGHLQRNKVKDIITKTVLIHSVDSLRLAEQIQLEAQKKEIICDILIEVNIAKEESKFGVSPQQTEQLIRDIAKFGNIRILGLMTVAPIVKNAEESRTYFKQMKQLYVDIANKNIDNVTMAILSMGMTNDYEVAIEEGATHVRIGTGIFGQRNYTIL